MLDVPTSGFRQGWEYANGEHCWHTDCPQANSDEESSVEMNGYSGWQGRMGG